ncbi:hypothetical protein P7K49_007493, partial [Saguinus oedipus]
MDVIEDHPEKQCVANDLRKKSGNVPHVLLKALCLVCSSSPVADTKCSLESQ